MDGALMPMTPFGRATRGLRLTAVRRDPLTVARGVFIPSPDIDCHQM